MFGWPCALPFWQVFDQGFHNFSGLKLQGTIGVGGGEEVCPFEGFGKAELVEGVDDGGNGLFGADDEDFDGFAIAFGVGVEFERNGKRDGF